jgi:hypothetical protein
MAQEDLAARLRRLELIELAKVATMTYGRACDRKDVEELRTNVFTNDIVVRLPSRELSGIDNVAGFYADVFAAEPGTRRHFLTNQVAEVYGTDRVHLDSYFFFLSADARSVIGWGSYHDVVVVEDDRPRISDKTIILDVHTDLDSGWAMSPLAPGLP